MGAIYLEGEWRLVAAVDEEGRLNLYVSNTGRSAVNEKQFEQIKAAAGEEVHLKFTTPKIDTKTGEAEPKGFFEL